MATMVWCLALLCLYNLMPPSESTTPDRRSEEVYEKYVIRDETGGAKSHLFSQCMEDANTVEGVLYSITVSGDEEYVRFVPKEKKELQWTIVDLEDGMGIVDCAQKAYELSAYMFKFDGSCNVALNSSYDPKSEQACDGAATEVVYITSRPFNVLDGEVVPFGEFRGCLYSSPDGMRYGERGRYVSEVQLPPPDVCSPTADKGYHLVADCSLDKMNYCEAEARCKARGAPMASKIFYDELLANEDWTSLPSDVAAEFSASGSLSTWVNIQKIDGSYQWMPDMVVIQQSEFDNSGYPDQECGFAEVDPSTKQTKLKSIYCYSGLSCVYCHDPNSLLPPC